MKLLREQREARGLYCHIALSEAEITEGSEDNWADGGGRMSGDKEAL